MNVISDYFCGMFSIFQQLSIFRKLLVAFVGVALFSVSFISSVYYLTFKNALIQRTKNQLVSINILKKIQVEDHLRKNSGYSVLFLEYVMQERTGMGNSGESYLVGADGRLITHSRFYPNKEPSLIRANTLGFNQAMLGQNGDDIYKDYRGVEVLGAYGFIDIGGRKIVILSEMDFEEAMKPVYAIRNYFLVFGIFVVVMITLVCIWLAKMLTAPIKKINRFIDDISDGKLELLEIPRFPDDEIGQMGNSLRRLVGALQKKTAFALHIGQGQYDSAYHPSGQGDELGKALVKMREDLIRLKESDKRMIRLRSASILEGEERERKRLAMDLHDGLGQLLTALKFRVEALDESVPTKVKLREILNEAILEVRKIAYNVMPAVLLDFGLEPALKQLSETFIRETGISVKFNSNAHVEKLSLDFSVQVGLYRIAQEAFTNIRKYANATLVVVSSTIENGFLTLEIKDNGAGFDLEEVKLKETNGLRNMRERAKLMGGTFLLDAKNGAGASILVKIPVESKD